MNPIIIPTKRPLIRISIFFTTLRLYNLKMLIDLAISKGVGIVIITWNPNRLARNGEKGGYLADRVRDRQIEAVKQILDERQIPQQKRELAVSVINSQKVKIQLPP